MQVCIHVSELTDQMLHGCFADVLYESILRAAFAFPIRYALQEFFDLAIRSVHGHVGRGHHNIYVCLLGGPG